MEIAKDVFDFLIAEAAFKGRHDFRASREDCRTNHRIGRGRAARKMSPLENSCEVGRNFREVGASPVMAATAVDFKQRFPGLAILDPVAFLGKCSDKPEETHG